MNQLSINYVKNVKKKRVLKLLKLGEKVILNVYAVDIYLMNI